MRTKTDMFFRGIGTVLWEKWVDFKFEWRKITASALVSPLLYMIALGWGLGGVGLAGPVASLAGVALAGWFVYSGRWKRDQTGIRAEQSVE